MSGNKFVGSRKKFSASEMEDLVTRRLEKAHASVPHVFLSFAAEDLNEINLLRAHAKNDDSDIEFDDFSVKEPYDSNDSSYIKSNIKDKIRHCSTVVVYISPSSATSKWVDWEIRAAAEMGKRVIGVYSGGVAPTSLPVALSELKAKVVSWKDLAATLAANP